MSMKIYFGVPGSGKTTHAASIVYRNLKQGVPTFSNVDIKGAYLFDPRTDIGQYQIENADMIIDEAGIDFNSRKTKEMPQSIIKWLKLYRHYGIRDVYIYSQSYIDMDITFRRLSDELFVVKRSLLPGVFSTRRIAVKIGIDEATHQITDLYFFSPFSTRLFLGRSYWGMFDSWAAPRLQDRPWILNGFGDVPPDPRELKHIYRKLRKEKSILTKLKKLKEKLLPQAQKEEASQDEGSSAALQSTSAHTGFAER